MPAMPTADSRAATVVGTRQSSSETRAIAVAPSAVRAALPGSSERTAMGRRVTTATRKTTVSSTSTRLSAISCGVFLRSAPSTRAIMRSMKLSPDCRVTRTTRRPDSTFVPPVTAERSPPPSRMTGADSPVTADSSTAATPCTTSPSPGIVSPASTATVSPRRRAIACTSFSPSFVSRWAVVIRRVRRRASAWALPRLSATASARLPETTASQSQTVLSHPYTEGWTTASPVVRAAPIPVTNMTGLRTSVTGLSLRRASGRASHSCTGASGRVPAPRCPPASGVRAGVARSGLTGAGAGAEVI